VLAPHAVAHPVQQQFLFRLDQALQRGQLERGERPVPGAVQCTNDGDGLLGQRGQRIDARIGYGPAAVVVAGGCTHDAGRRILGQHAVMTAGQVGVVRLPV
jgi:hypothetical protein